MLFVFLLTWNSLLDDERLTWDYEATPPSLDDFSMIKELIGNTMLVNDLDFSLEPFFQRTLGFFVLNTIQNTALKIKHPLQGQFYVITAIRTLSTMAGPGKLRRAAKVYTLVNLFVKAHFQASRFQNIDTVFNAWIANYTAYLFLEDEEALLKTCKERRAQIILSRGGAFRVKPSRRSIQLASDPSTVIGVSNRSEFNLSNYKEGLGIEAINYQELILVNQSLDYFENLEINLSPTPNTNI